MRTITQADRLDIRGLPSHSLGNFCFSDVDGDGRNELIFSNWNSTRVIKSGEVSVGKAFGSVYIFKYHSLSRIADHLSVVSCIAVGDVCNDGLAHILVVCADCCTHIFHWDIVENLTCPVNISSTFELFTGEIKSYRSSFCKRLKPIHQLFLPYNAHCLCIEDVDGDGLNELLVGHTDRSVRLFRWHKQQLQTGLRKKETGYFEQLLMWDLAGQVSSISLHRVSPQTPIRIIVSQPGGAFAELHYLKGGRYPPTPYLTHHSVLASRQNGNFHIKTKVLGSVRKSQKSKNSTENYLVLCTLDGAITLVDVADAGSTTVESIQQKAPLEDTILWELQVHRELFSLYRLTLPMGRDTQDAVALATWEGLTYVLNDSKELYRFFPGFPCQSFCAGQYALSEEESSTVFLYGFTAECNMLSLFYNFHKNLLSKPQSLLHCLTPDMEEKLASTEDSALTDLKDLPSKIAHLLYHHSRRANSLNSSSQTIINHSFDTSNSL